MKKNVSVSVCLASNWICCCRRGVATGGERPKGDLGHGFFSLSSRCQGENRLQCGALVQKANFCPSLVIELPWRWEFSNFRYASHFYFQSFLPFHAAFSLVPPSINVQNRKKLNYTTRGNKTRFILFAQIQLKPKEKKRNKALEVRFRRLKTSFALSLCTRRNNGKTSWLFHTKTEEKTRKKPSAVTPKKGRQTIVRLGSIRSESIRSLVVRSSVYGTHPPRRRGKKSDVNLHTF